MIADVVGSVGVALLLVAFVLNAAGRMTSTGAAYHGMNVVGSALACSASAMIGYVPFVVLEGCWCLVAVVGLGRALRS